MDIHGSRVMSKDLLKEYVFLTTYDDGIYVDIFHELDEYRTEVMCGFYSPVFEQCFVPILDFFVCCGLT